MKIEKFKIFESKSVDDVSEMIESCKDIIETFNELDHECKVIHYKSGYSYKDGSGFELSATSEDRFKCIIFYLNIPDMRGVESASDIEKLYIMLKASKVLYLKLNLYCSNIHYELNSISVKFKLLFDNTDDMRPVKIKRIIKGIDKYLSNYNVSKRIWFQRKDNSGEISNKKLYDYMIASGLIKEDPRPNISLSYSTTVSYQDGDKILIGLSSFKLKVDPYFDSFKSFKPTNEMLEEIVRVFADKVVNKNSNVSGDKGSISYECNGNKVLFKIK